MAQKERLDALNKTQKTSALCKKSLIFKEKTVILPWVILLWIFLGSLALRNHNQGNLTLVKLTLDNFSLANSTWGNSTLDIQALGENTKYNLTIGSFTSGNPILDNLPVDASSVLIILA